MLKKFKEYCLPVLGPSYYAAHNRCLRTRQANARYDSLSFSIAGPANPEPLNPAFDHLSPGRAGIWGLEEGRSTQFRVGALGFGVELGDVSFDNDNF